MALMDWCICSVSAATVRDQFRLPTEFINELNLLYYFTNPY